MGATASHPQGEPSGGIEASVVARATLRAHLPSAPPHAKLACVRPAPSNPEPTRPAGLRVVERDGTIFASWRWFDLQSILHLVMGVVCLALTVGAATQQANLIDGPEAAVGLAVFGLVGLLLTYSGVAQMVNRTTIAVTAEDVSVAIGPLPWPGAGRWTTAGTQAMFVDKTAWQFNYRHWFKVMAISRGTRVQLGHALQDAAMARWLVWLVESKVGIPHVATYEGPDG